MNDPRDEIIHVRMSPNERAYIEALARKISEAHCTDIKPATLVYILVCSGAHELDADKYKQMYANHQQLRKRLSEKKAVMKGTKGYNRGRNGIIDRISNILHCLCV